MSRRRVTNRLGLPEPYVRAVENDEYDPGHSDYTATSLLQPARLRRLVQLHPDECVQDASELADSLLGQAVHTILERAAKALNEEEPGRYLAEERIYDTFVVDGKPFKVSAQVDLYDRKERALYDYKSTAAYALKYGPKDEHAFQLGLQEELLRVKGEAAPETRTITAVVKDWKAEKAGADDFYPEAPAVNVPHEPMSSEQVRAWVESRVREHERAKALSSQSDPQFPLCSEGETWARTSADRFAARRPTDGWTAKLFETRAEAEAYVSSKPHLQLVVEERLGPAVRCRDWCPARRVCEQWRVSPRNPLNQERTKERGEATAPTTDSPDDDMVEVRGSSPFSRRK